MKNRKLKSLLLDLDPDAESQVLVDSMEEISTEIENVLTKVEAIDIEGQIAPVREDLKSLRSEIVQNQFKGDQGNSGIDGIDGRDGKDGRNGKDGRDGKDGKKGDRGDPGKDGKDANVQDILSRVQGRGGSINRQIFIGGVDPLTRYTDINLKAGSNVTLTYQNNDTTHKVDVTIASSGGSGSVGGVIRSINTISTSQTAGATSGTDYVYICSAGVNLTLPTAVSNTNLYTVKNTSSSSVLVSTTSAQTIDTQSNVIMPVQFTSIDLISDNSNWEIT